jgi:predicted aminopeptidase
MKISLGPVIPVFPTLAAALIFAGAMVLFSGCYVLRQGVTMLGYLRQAVPLEDIAEGEAGGEEERAFVQRIHEIRRFASEDLGLASNSNYTKYVELPRDYLAAVVSASEKDSFTRHEWWFPVTGSVPYKGFFDEEEAREEALCLKDKGFDVWVRRVDAFSTLGWFSDPLYSYMKKYPVWRLADLIIHEQLHATVYLAGNSQFNEELAEFVGTEGARRYMARTFGEASEEYAAMVRQKEDSASYVAFIHGLAAELESLYASALTRGEKLRKKEEIIAAAKKRFEENYENLFHGEAYRGFAGLPVNNAYLELFRLYYAKDNYLRDFYLRAGGDLKKFIDAAKTLDGDGDPRARFEKALGLAPSRSGE